MLDDTREETVSQAGNGEPGTNEAEALAAVLNHSAERVQNLWFSFLTFMLYLAIATGSTTDRMLFLEEPLKLPVLNIPLPLLAFYILTPFIFVVLHFYMLLNLVLLARTAKSFEDALACAFPEDGEARENFRMRIENTLFVQLLVGAKREREGFNAKLLSFMALITLALAPVLLLLIFETQFLAYHDPWTTWWHRILLAVDLGLVWTLWPGYRRGWGVVRFRPKLSWRLVRTGVLSVAVLAFSVTVATFPDEHFVPISSGLATLDLQVEDLIEGEKVARIEKNESLAVTERWEPSLKDEGRDLPGEAWEPARRCVYRDLTGANLTYADVRHVDFSGSILNRAVLWYVRGKNTTFFQAQLKGALLYKAQLQGADFRGALLQGASLQRAQLQGASLQGAKLQGANLKDAQLQGANLEGAGLEGANLMGAHLQGAILDNAHLQGATLNGAQLQGASLHETELQGGSLTNAFVWRADLREAKLKDAKVDGVEKDPKYGCHRNNAETAEIGENKCDWTAERFEKLKKMIAEQVPDGNNRRKIMERIEHKLDPNKDLAFESDMKNVWVVQERLSHTKEVYEKGLEKQWRNMGCGPDEERPFYVFHGLALQLIRSELSPFDNNSPERRQLASAFLDEAHCPGAHGLSEADKAKLKEIAAPAALQAPKP